MSGITCSTAELFFFFVFFLVIILLHLMWLRQNREAKKKKISICVTHNNYNTDCRDRTTMPLLINSCHVCYFKKYLLNFPPSMIIGHFQFNGFPIDCNEIHSTNKWQLMFLYGLFITTTQSNKIHRIKNLALERKTTQLYRQVLVFKPVLLNMERIIRRELSTISINNLWIHG